MAAVTNIINDCHGPQVEKPLGSDASIAAVQFPYKPIRQYPFWAKDCERVLLYCNTWVHGFVVRVENGCSVRHDLNIPW